MAGVGVRTSLTLGRNESDSAKQRQRNAYKQDLELQIQEKQAARQRERLQDMNVNASGFLDPEKRPDRFKPLGGAHWLDQREKRSTDRVRPYHTLFLYDSTNATGGSFPNNAVDQAYSFYGAQDLTRGAGGGGVPLVQPISIPHGDNRPIILHAPGGGDNYQGPRFNPFEKKDDNPSRDFQSLLIITQSEKDRIRRENEEFQRRLRQELEDERKKITDQENEAKRRLDELRRLAEERRREAERERKEAMRLKRLQEQKPQTEPVRPKSKKTMLYYDMDDYRLKLIEERKRIEELLKAGKPTKEVWDLKVVQKPPRNLPPTPKSADRANRDNVNDFNSLKFKDGTRNEFRAVFPDVPMTNKRLEQQQEALLHHQEANFRDNAFKAAPLTVDVPPRRAISRPSWLDRDPTPFPHVLKQRDRLYTSHSETDLSYIDRKARDRMRALENSSPTNGDALEGLKLRNHRTASTETLADDTWLRPSSTADI